MNFCFNPLDIVLKKTLISSLLLIVKDLTGLGPVVFSFTLEGFPRKNLGVLLVYCLINFSTLFSVS
jgi:hypothetical protein